MRQLFPIFQTTAPEGTAQALPLYWDVDMDYDKGVPRFSGGEPVLASGLEAVKGWAWRALHTERYRWSPFSWDYGCELESLVGQPYRADTRLSEAVRYVREALTVCPYITGAAAEVVGFDGSTLRMRVSLTTVYGAVSYTHLDVYKRQGVLPVPQASLDTGDVLRHGPGRPGPDSGVRPP